MLQLKNITKTYQHEGGASTAALRGISLSFRPREFVAILGPSGSGKTTLLNVIGGLDHYDSGDLIISGQSTKNFKETDWDAYRNNSVGFVFQSYNLISHLSILANVELGMTLSGVAKDEKRQKAIQALKDVGLGDQIGKNPNQLSGGQMQRVSIARALADDPDILLCDEPTGALDSKTSVQIMDLIKEISKKRLVIMVTHNAELAQEYATRIIHFKDGEVTSDSNPYAESERESSFQLKRTKMSYWNAVKLSFTNLLTKKGQTILTALASSIGIISIAVVLSLSNGLQRQIDQTMSKTLAQYPISIAQTSTNVAELQKAQESNKSVKNHGYAIVKSDFRTSVFKHNKITPAFIRYVKKINPDYVSSIALMHSASFNMLAKRGNQAQTVTFSNVGQSSNSDLFSVQNKQAQSMGMGSPVFPTSLRNGNENSFLKNNYQLLSGHWPKAATDLVLVLDNRNSVTPGTLENLALPNKAGSHIKYRKLVGQEFKVIKNDDYYQQMGGRFIPQEPSLSLYNKGALTLRIAAVIKPKNRNAAAFLSTGIAYSQNLSNQVINLNKNSAIVRAQRNSRTSVINGQRLGKNEKTQALQMLGGSSIPTSIMIYPNNFDSKDHVINYLKAWNKGKNKANKIEYNDMSSVVTQMTGGLLTGITAVLIAFAAISLVTSMIMIGILTYTSVLERTREIGVLKALGARKRDITRVFDSETFLLGIFSGVLGVVIAYALTFPVNNLLYSLTKLKSVAVLNPMHALWLIIIATVLTLLGGHIPARMAAKKDAASALRAQ